MGPEILMLIAGVYFVLMQPFSDIGRDPVDIVLFRAIPLVISTLLVAAGLAGLGFAP